MQGMTKVDLLSDLKVLRYHGENTISFLASQNPEGIGCWLNLIMNQMGNHFASHSWPNANLPNRSRQVAIETNNIVVLADQEHLFFHAELTDQLGGCAPIFALVNDVSINVVGESKGCI